MWNFAKKLALASVTTMLAATASLSAFDNISFDQNYFGGEYDCCQYGDDCLCGNWGIEAGVLLWKAQPCNVPVGRSVSTVTSTTGVITIPGDGTITGVTTEERSQFAKFIDSRWRPGARVDLIYSNPDNCWDFKLCWDYLHNSDSTTLSLGAPPGVGPVSELIPAWTSGLPAPFPVEGALPITGTSIHGKWGLNYNAIALGFGHTFKACCDKFTLRPHIDLKLAWIRQRVTIQNDTDYTGFLLTTGPFAGANVGFTIRDQVQASRDYFGIGPQFGFDMNYNICGGLGIYAKASTAVLYGDPNVKISGSIASVSDEEVLDFTAGNVSLRRTDPKCLNLNTMVGVGVSYLGRVCDDAYGLTVKIGWEHHLYFDQSGYIRDLSVPGVGFANQGNLSLYGLTATVGLDF